MWLEVLIVLYILLALVLVVSLIINGVKPSKTLGWLLAIFTIPLGGILLYLMLGRNRRTKKLSRLRRKIMQKKLQEIDPELFRHSDKYKKLMRLVNTNCYFPPTRNLLQPLEDGKTTADIIFNALSQAESYIHIQYYIFEEGEWANQLLELFREKVKAGVTIRMIYDGVGSYSLSKGFLKQLKAIGVQALPFLPFRFGRFLTTLNYRNHRKIIVVDGTVAFTGGMNISDKYLKGGHHLGLWQDLHLRLEGPAAVQLDAVFLSDWFMVSQEDLSHSIPALYESRQEGILTQIVSSGPDDDFPTIEQSYFSIISEAEDYVYIVNPYIIPSQEILNALQVIALSGVDTRLLISKKSDSKLVYWCVRSFFEPLLKSGIRIYLFPEGFLHSKLIVSDDDIVSIGTANIDIRSFEHNYEVNAMVYDVAFALRLKESFKNECKRSEELTYEQHLQRPLTHKLLEGIARIFAPVL